MRKPALLPKQIWQSISGLPKLLGLRPRTLGLAVSLAASLVACTTPPTAPVATKPPPAIAQGKLALAQWADLPGWKEDDVRAAWSGWLSGCRVLIKRNPWQPLCTAAKQVDANSTSSIRSFFEDNFLPYRLSNDDGTNTGLITGYYEPLLKGSRTKGGAYQTPLHRMPSSWKNKGSLPTSGEIRGQNLLSGQEIVYVDDAVDAAFLQIQGSGRIALDNGTMLRVGFAGTNDRPFQSIARWLLDRGEIKANQATMQGIKAWAKRNPSRVKEMLNANPRYVFFKESPIQHDEGPNGALGVSLTNERSIAIDPRSTPLGAPVFVATTRPLSNQPLQRLMFAQDTGSAIKGAVRADFFWGYGDAAGEIAGRMKQTGQMWVLWPR